MRNRMASALAMAAAVFFGTALGAGKETDHSKVMEGLRGQEGLHGEVGRPPGQSHAKGPDSGSGILRGGHAGQPDDSQDSKDGLHAVLRECSFATAAYYVGWPAEVTIY